MSANGCQSELTTASCRLELPAQLRGELAGDLDEARRGLLEPAFEAEAGGGDVEGGDHAPRGVANRHRSRYEPWLELLAHDREAVAAGLRDRLGGAGEPER